jgi:hypothetical protein
MKRYECNKCMVDIDDAIGISKTNLRRIRKQASCKQKCNEDNGE